MLKENKLFLFCLFYFFCAIIYAVSPIGNPTFVGWTTLIGETSMDILIAGLSLKLYYMTQGKRRQLFGLMAISYICECIADSSYNLLQNVWGISNPPIFVSSIFEIPLLLFLCIQTLIWWELFVESNNHGKKKKTPLFSYIPFVISSFFIFGMFLYFAGWKVDRISGEGIYQLTDVFVETASFALVSICLGASANRAISSIAIGFLLIVCSNYMIRLPVVALATIQNNPFEFTWIAGQLLVTYGLIYFKQNQQENSIENWCYGVNSLQSQIAAGGFCLGLLAIVLFSVFAEYALHITSSSKNILKYFPPVMILFSIVTVILSSYFSKRLLKPLKALEAIIDSYFYHGKFDSVLESHEDYGIREYIDLKLFIKSALLSLHEQFTIERQTSALAASVAHDIASPLAFMEMTLHAHGVELSSPLKEKLSNAIQGVRNIAYNLLEKYRNPNLTQSVTNIASNYSINEEPNQTPCAILLPYLIELVLSQKKVEWTENPCEIKFENGLNSNVGWIYASQRELRRVISNLLNNAYEALHNKRIINITIRPQQASFISLQISDTGCGIPAEYLSQVLEGKSLKHSGKGLGLSNARKFIETLDGKLLINSTVGEGTQIKLLIPQAASPEWFPENILVDTSSPILILDDDESIFTLWGEYFKSLDLEIHFFSRVNFLIDWCSRNRKKLSRAIYLFDHHLQDPVWTGLALLEKLQAGKRGYLVTSEAGETSIQTYCMQLGAWLIPKTLIHTIPLKNKPHLLTDSIMESLHENNSLN